MKKKDVKVPVFKQLRDQELTLEFFSKVLGEKDATVLLKKYKKREKQKRLGFYLIGFAVTSHIILDGLIYAGLIP